ncbi:hypothetical protein [Chitinophaga sp.]|uniref:hypothetical protein n=1 Tax=Chitinophaga sp. TaxID=1869181 RepID=UPI002628D8E4|nr:hypothetical protein [uncultured Chitinophaga sp.]
MKQTFYSLCSLLLIVVFLDACKKHPSPIPGHGKCPEAADCQLQTMHVSNWRGFPYVNGPTFNAQVRRDAQQKPIWFKGHPTHFTGPMNCLITYHGRQLKFIDSISGKLVADVWLNDCGQPDSSAFYAPDEPSNGLTPHKTKYHYHHKQLSGWTNYAWDNPPSEEHVTRDQHGNVTRLGNDNNYVSYTYDLSKPAGKARFLHCNYYSPAWTLPLTLEYLGFLQIGSKHLPNHSESWGGGYRFSTVDFSNFVISGDKIHAYDVTDGYFGPNGTLLYTVSMTWNCRGGGKW